MRIMKKRIAAFLLVVLFVIILIGGIFAFATLYSNRRDANTTETSDAITLEGEIVEVVRYGEHATLHLRIHEEIVALNLQEDTIIQNAENQGGTIDDLLEGLTIEAMVDPDVWYDTWQDIETGLRHEMTVYYKCHKIIIR